ncbi:MAG: hypothetical protein RLZZ459_2391 [Cyanobacteriota bacterium]|jgi:hypothetical protein
MLNVESELLLYAPHCQGLLRRPELEVALDLFAAGGLRGARRLRPSGSRPFQMNWQVVASPLVHTAVTLVFAVRPDAPTVDYSFSVPSYRLVQWLMDRRRSSDPAEGLDDLPDSFWHWLIVGDEPAAIAA